MAREIRPKLAHTGVMDHARISQLRDHLSRYLDRVRAGGEVIVLDRERPIARIVPMTEGASPPAGDDTRLASLERRGLLRRGRGRLPAGWRNQRPARVDGSVLDALRAERESGW
jgi:prevent-host-death family protein